MNNKIFIGLSWPYANNELHIGHLGSSLPADILARYFRLNGDEVCFVSGSDCFGTPISIQAQKENKSPDEIANFYHEKFVEIFKGLDFSFDKYTQTNNTNHVNFAKSFHKNIYSIPNISKLQEKRLFCNNCNRYLPDRYVIGNCPKCGHDTKGDSCEKCGSILEPEDLINPKCSLCGNNPTPKETYQYYLKLSSLEPKLKSYFDSKKSNWSQNAINLTSRYFDEGLKDRAITRNLDWGVPLPIEATEDKVIYNWGENVLGYLSACKQWCEENNKNFDEWFKNNNARHIYIHAKDNIPFHSIIFPALLLSNTENYHLPDNIFAYEYVTNNGQKISKSKGTCLTARSLLEKYPTDFIRFYFSKNISDKKDLDFKEQDFIQTINGELINNWGNFVNRTLSFIQNKFNGKINVQRENIEIKNKIRSTYKIVSSYLNLGKISNAVSTILDLVNFSNKYFDETKPWIVFNENKQKCEELLYDYLVLITNISILFLPILTKGSKQVLEWLNIENISFNYTIPTEIHIENIHPLFNKIEVN